MINVFLILSALAHYAHALVSSGISSGAIFTSLAPRLRSSMKFKKFDDIVLRSSLDNFSNLSSGENSPDDGSSISRSGPQKRRKKFKPHAPDAPPPSDEVDGDQAIIDEAKDLMKIQRAIRKASSSPTYVIPRRDPTATMLVPDKDQTLKPEPSISETASALSSSADFLRSGQTRPFRTMELLNDSRMRAKKRLSRSDFEKKKAEEKKAKIKAKLEAQLLEIDNGLKEKLASAQNAIDDEVENMRDLIIAELSLENERVSQFVLLVDNLHSSINAIKADIKSEKNIATEMRELRSKLKDDSDSAFRLDSLLIQKEDLLSVEEKLLRDLNQCIMETRLTLKDADDRANKMRDVLTKIDAPSLDALGNEEDRKYDWSDIDDMETVLTEAADNVSRSEVLVASLRDRIARALLEKDAILKTDTQANKGKSGGSFDYWNSGNSVVVKLSELQEWDDTEVLKQLAVSLGNATFSGSKAAVFALKTFIEAASKEEVMLNAGQACEKSKLIGNPSNGTFKDASRSALDAFVDTAKAYFETVSSNDAGKKANANLNDATKELTTAANAITALGMRAYQKFLEKNNTV